MTKFNCIYTEVNDNRQSKNYGLLVERVKKFPTFAEAYYALGLLAVSLTDDYVIHTGSRRSTYGLRMEG